MIQTNNFGVRTSHKQLTGEDSQFKFDHENIRDLGREEREERTIRSHLLMIQTNNVGVTVRTSHKQLTGENSQFKFDHENIRDLG
jgi:hypothetical protein